MILVANGGLGSAYDELELNRGICEKYGIKVRGVLLNKVRLRRIHTGSTAHFFLRPAFYDNQSTMVTFIVMKKATNRVHTSPCRFAELSLFRSVPEAESCAVQWQCGAECGPEILRSGGRASTTDPVCSCACLCVPVSPLVCLSVLSFPSVCMSSWPVSLIRFSQRGKQGRS